MTLRLVALAALLSTPALARDGDTEACEGLDDGDACTRANGDGGTCAPDASDGDVLACDDDATAGVGDDSAAGCAIVPGPGWLAVGLAALALRRR